MLIKWSGQHLTLCYWNLLEKKKNWNQIQWLRTKNQQQLVRILQIIKQCRKEILWLQRLVHLLHVVTAHCVESHHRTSIVNYTKVLETPCKTFQLKQKLNCTNYGIYAAACTICSKQYGGQTLNSLFAGMPTVAFGNLLTLLLIMIKQLY